MPPFSGQPRVDVASASLLQQLSEVLLKDETEVLRIAHCILMRLKDTIDQRHYHADSIFVPEVRCASESLWSVHYNRTLG